MCQDWSNWPGVTGLTAVTGSDDCDHDDVDTSNVEENQLEAMVNIDLI